MMIPILKKYGCFLLWLAFYLPFSHASDPSTGQTTDLTAEATRAATERLFLEMHPQIETEELLAKFTTSFQNQIASRSAESQEALTLALEQSIEQELSLLEQFFFEYFSQSFTAEEIDEATEFFRAIKKPGAMKFVEIFETGFLKQYNRKTKEMEKRLLKQTKDLLKDK